MFSEPHNRFKKDKPDVGAVADRDKSITETNLARQLLGDIKDARAAQKNGTVTPTTSTPPASIPTSPQQEVERQEPPVAERKQFPAFLRPQGAPPAGSSVPDSATAIIEPKQPSGTAINPLRPGLSATPSAVPQPVAPETLPSSDQVTKGVSTENLPAVDTPNATAEKLSEWVGSNVPKFEDGGATPVADNATLVSDTGEAVARVNTNENISIKNGMMDVTPANRVDPNDLQQKTEERQDMQTEQIDETEEDNTVPVNHGSMATSIAQGNPNWENMVTDMSQSSAPENFHQTGSARRAYELATSFNSSPVKHYGGFSTTTRFT
jgi:hypothetical protein